MSIITGTSGNDTLTGTSGSDQLFGLGGADTLYGQLGNDLLDGGPGIDWLIGGFGNDTLLGGDDADFFTSEDMAGNDSLVGGAGNDWFFDMEGNNTLNGGNGGDTFSVLPYFSGANTITGGQGQDLYVIEKPFSFVVPNTLVTDFAGGAGGDLVDVGNLLIASGSNGFSGGNPFDINQAFLRLHSSGPNTLLQWWDKDATATTSFDWVTVLILQNIAPSSVTSANFVGDIPPDGSVPAGQVIVGTNDSDRLTGRFFNDQLSGFDGDDTLDGSGGHDTLDGGAGYDLLTGGLGNDSLIGGADIDQFSDPYGDNVLFGGGGDDRFEVYLRDTGANIVTGGAGRDQYQIVRTFSGYNYAVTDFAVGTGGDQLNVDRILYDSEFLGAYVGGDPFLSVLRLVQTGPDTVLQWDPDAEGADFDWYPVITLQNVAPTELTADNIVNHVDGSTEPGQVITGTDGDDALEGGSGNDTLLGGAGDDFFRDWSGNNVLDGGNGVDRFDIGGFSFEGDISKNTIVGGAGRDVYEFSGLTFADLNYQVVTDFAIGSNGDLLDVDQLLATSGHAGGYSGGNPFELGYLRLIQSGPNTLLQWDLDGQQANPLVEGSPDNWGWATQLTLLNITATTITSYNFVGQLIVGTEADDALTGGLGDDTILGLGGNDTIDGGPGDNIVQGDAGEDVALLSGSLADYSISILSPGQDGRTFADYGFGLQPGVYVNIVNQNGRIDRVVGVERARFLGNPATSADDVEIALTPAAGLKNAAVNFGDNYRADSNSTNLLVGGAENDVLDGLGGADTLQGNAGNDVLLGGVGNDYLEGGTGNDALNGQAGADTLVGGADNDNYIVDTTNDVVIEQSAAGTADRVQSLLATYSLAVLPEIEVLEYVGAAAFHGTGHGGANILIGKTGADTLLGGGGDDTLLGAGGADVFIGGAGNDSIDGGTGTDLVMLGGDREEYVYENLAGLVRIINSVSGENDQVKNVERVRFGDGTEATLASILASTPTEFADSLVGGESADSINALAGNDTVRGNGGNDTLDGGTGHDLLIGGTGSDTYLVDSASDQVLELPLAGVDLLKTGLASFALAENVEQLLYTGSGNFAGTGNASPNLLTGSTGSDTLDGGAGADTLVGGAGNDTYLVDTQADVLVDSGGTSDTVVAFAPYSFASNPAIENGSAAAGTASVNLTGNAGDNILTGNAGANVLDGGAGNDTLIGGRGDDTYVVDSAGDVLVEFSGQGRDTVVTPFSTVLASPFENLSLSGSSSVNATGNAAGNLLRGNSGNNVLDGAGGLDTMDGGAGNDSYVIDRLLEQGLISDSGGIDTVISIANYTGLQAGLENLTLAAKAWIGLGNDTANVITGTLRANILIGGGGNDTLIGGGGADLLDGGSGADRFVFDTALSASNIDFIVDFSAAQGDRIVLDDDIFAASTFGVHILLDSGGGLYYDFDGAGGGAAVQFAILANPSGVGAANFLVID